MVYNLSENPSVLSIYLSEIRDVQIQKDSMRFRKNLERISEIVAYEISKKLSYHVTTIQTPLSNADVHLLDQQPVIATILRAGLAMHTGMMNVFDHSDSAFISAYRTEKSDKTFQVDVEYVGVPDFNDKTLIISDPMLATGSSMLAVYQTLMKMGKPKRVVMAVTIATEFAIDFLHQNISDDFDIYAAAIDKELNEKSYIVPGLGDAGDLAFGIKVE